MRSLRAITGYLLVALFMAIFGAYCGLNPGGAYLEVDALRCTGCAECTSVCPVDAVRLKGGKAIIDPSKCVTCGKCVEVCPENAIQ
jgi:ferredoxin